MFVDPPGDCGTFLYFVYITVVSVSDIKSGRVHFDPVIDTLSVALQLLDALMHMAMCGVVHNDISGKH